MNKSAIFHRGELVLQKQAGMAECIDAMGRHMIKDHLSPKHCEFYEQLSFILLGYADAQGRLWVSLLSTTGKLLSVSPDKLQIHQLPARYDVLSQTLANFEEKSPIHIGGLGIDFATRKRVRFSGQVITLSSEGFHIDIAAAFGNCPRYIQQRRLSALPKSKQPPESVQVFDHFDGDLSRFIPSADTFFVASSSDTYERKGVDNIDVSHRGGEVGFVQVVDEKTLLIPDYSGNYMFNTLGNFLVNPHCGLLFVDFQQGSVYQLTGKAQIIENSKQVHNFAGAERLWSFTLEQGLHLRHALNITWDC